MTIQTFNSMLGKTMVKATGYMFETAEGDVFRFDHSQACCESVDIEDICGDLADLVGSPMLIAEEISSDNPPPLDYDPESYTWTFYRFGTAKGTVTVRWLGTSNGYYSESVDYSEELAKGKSE